MDKFNESAVGVLDLERVIPRSRLGAIARLQIETLVPEVGAHLLNVVDRETNMAQHVRRRCWSFIEQLNVLMIVDLHECDFWFFASLLLNLKILIKSEQIVPEFHRFWQIGDKIPHMRDACNARPLWTGAIRHRVKLRGRKQKSADSIHIAC